MNVCVLMSAPRFTPAIAGDRSWLPDGEALDPGRAHEQWMCLRSLVAEHIGTVVELQAEPWAPAMTFTRDLATVIDSHVVPLVPASTRGPFEAPLAHRRLTELGVDLVDTPHALRFDGGNVLADAHGRLLIGVTTAETDDAFMAVVRFLEETTGRPAFRVPLNGERFPHVDMAVCDLNGAGWLVYPPALPGLALADPDWSNLFLGLPVIIAEPDDGELLGCNLVVGDGCAIGPQISSRLQHQLDQLGMHYIGTPLTELLKAGGGAHCLTLELPNLEAN